METGNTMFLVHLRLSLPFSPSFISTGVPVPGCSTTDLHFQPILLFVSRQGLTKLSRLSSNLRTSCLSLLSSRDYKPTPSQLTRSFLKQVIKQTTNMSQFHIHYLILLTIKQHTRTSQNYRDFSVQYAMDCYSNHVLVCTAVIPGGM